MANEYLTRTPTSGGNQRVWTWSGWVKRNTLVANRQGIFATTNNAGTVFTGIEFDGNERLQWYEKNLTSGTTVVNTSQTFRDTGNWMHIFAVFNSTASSSQDRAKIYVNGALITSFTTDARANIPINMQSEVNGISYPSYIGSWAVAAPTLYSRAELTDVFFVDGQALTPDVFGKYIKGNGYISAGSTQSTDFRKGQWVPKAPRVIKSVINARGGFGVNGFYLPMNDSTNFGADFHCDPNSIIKLNEELAQPKVGVSTATIGLGYTDVLRADPYAANLVLALPFVSSGLCTNGTNVGVNTGFGDYSHIIRNSGVAKTITISGSVSIASTASYYGSAASFTGIGGTHILSPDHNDFKFGSGDYTVEFWCNPSRTINYEEIVSKGFPWQLYRSNTGAFALAASADNSSYWVNNNIGIGSTGQWHHIAISKKDSTTYGFLNGVCGFAVTNSSSIYDGTSSLVIGSYDPSFNTYPFQGYIQDLRIYKGVAKYTGGFDVPRPYTPVGIATWRAVPDTPANNFATWNPVSPASDTTFTNGNLTVAYGSNATRGVVTGTVGIAVTGAGKYYWENRIDASSASPTNAVIGVWGMSTSTSAANYPGFTNTYGWSYYGNSSGSDGFYWATGGAVSNRSYGATYTTGDIISVTLDMTTNNGSLEFYKNGVSQGVATTGIGTFLTDGKIHAIMPAIGDGAGTATYTISSNFGQNPTFSGNTTAGTFTDSNGKGLFKYQPPSGFLALCEDNLPTPAIADPGKHFKTVLYTGDGNNGRSITGIGFTPDLVWIKNRNTTNNHNLYDSVRGPNIGLFSDLTIAELNYNSPPDGPQNRLLSFDNDGISIGSPNAINGSGNSIVAWCWRAGAGTTSTNTNGSITSVVSVNQDAGFSIVSWTSNGNTSVVTTGHGLAKTPKFIITKNRDVVDGWFIYHESIQTNNRQYLQFNTTATTTAGADIWSTSSSTFGIRQSTIAANGQKCIAYCWAEIEGFSKFGSYVGTVVNDGPFVYCGFKPAWIMIKRTDATNDWVIFDSSRNSTNPANAYLESNTSDIETTDSGAGSRQLDILSNGFKLRDSAAAINASGGTYIFVAFAESPFKTANSK